MRLRATKLSAIGFGGARLPLPSLDLQFAADKTLTARRGPTPAFSRASTATFVGSDGLIQSAVINAPRFDHDPVTLACKGLLIEEQRTNLCLRSEEFENGIWAKSSAIVTAPVVTANQANSPSGVLSADRIVFPAVSGAGAFSLVTQFFSQSAGVVHTASIYLRGLVGGEKVWWAWTPNGSTYVRKECVLTTAWQRFDFTYTSTSGNNFTQLGVDLRDVSQSAQSAQTIFAWGAQLEAGSFPTSYIPTTTAAVVRSADVCSITGSDFTGFYNQSEGTLFAQCQTPTANQYAGIAVIGTASFNHNIALFKSDTTGGTVGSRFVPYVTQAGSLVALHDFGNGSGNGNLKVLASVALNNVIFARNGTLSPIDTSAAMPIPNRIIIGGRADGNYINGHIASIRYYKKRLPNAKLQSLTT